MRNLLCAGFSRLWRSKLFYLGALAVSAQVAYTLINNLYYKALWGLADLTATNLIFSGTYYLPIVIAVFVSFYVGVEHSDKTLRNKLVVGHSRVSIYLANLITCAAAALMMYVIGSALVISVGAPLLGGFSGAAHEIVLMILCSLLTVVALTSLLVLCNMLISNRAVGVIISILLVIALIFFITPKLSQMLSEFETIGGWSYTDQDGVVHEVPERPNPRYLSGFSRTVVQFLHEMLPTGQIVEYGEIMPEHLALFPLYSLLFIALTTLGGLFFFKRKDLK